MATYQYKARNKHGKSIEGVMNADAESAVVSKLEEMGCIPIKISPKEKDSHYAKVMHKFKGVHFSELNLFTRQLYTMHKAGVPLLSSLNSLRLQVTNEKFKDTIGQVARDVEAGATLSSALENQPAVFNPLYVNMIKAGELSGRMTEVLERLAILGEHDEKIQLKIKAAMRYPLIVVAAIVIGFLVLITIVMPRFVNLYGSFEVALPLPTQILIGLNYAITQYWWLMIIVLGAAYAALHKFVSTAKGLYWLDSVKLKIPVFGPLLLKLTMSRFSRITGTLIESSVPILKILELVSEGVGNAVVSKTIDQIRESVKEGEGMSEPMKESELFPPTVIQMIAVGEETGNVDELMIHVSDYYDSQIDYTIENLISLIEPILTLALGVCVLFLALGIFLPMWSLMDLFDK